MRVAALCAGYGGLELGLTLAGIDVELAWWSEIDDEAARVMAHHHPDAPNLGDLTTIENPPPVDIVTAGFPCQPVSHAGLREGVNDDRWLIHDVVGLARRTGARWLILENVSGLYSANDGEAFAQVVDALAEGGFDAEWSSLRASDVGACHRRGRWFCVAQSADTGRLGRLEGSGSGWGEPSRLGGNGSHDDGREAPLTELLPTPTRRHWKGKTNENRRGRMLPDAVALLPTPAASNPNDGEDPDRWLARKQYHAGRTDQEPTRAGVPLSVAVRGGLLPTPTSGDSKASGSGKHSDPDNRNVILTDATVRGLTEWNRYGPAIERHALEVAERPPPDPVNSTGQLSPLFVEWMMGLPDGWVTGLGLKRSAMLRVLGNGVVPQAGGRSYRRARPPDEHLTHDTIGVSMSP